MHTVKKIRRPPATLVMLAMAITLAVPPLSAGHQANHQARPPTAQTAGDSPIFVFGLESSGTRYLARAVAKTIQPHTTWNGERPGCVELPTTDNGLTDEDGVPGKKRRRTVYHISMPTGRFCDYAEDPRVPFGTYTYPKLTGASRDAHARLMKLTNKYLMDTMSAPAEGNLTDYTLQTPKCTADETETAAPRPMKKGIATGGSDQWTGRWFVNITSTLAAHPGGKALIIYRDEAYTRESKLFGHCLSGGRDRSPRPQDLARVAAYADQEQAYARALIREALQSVHGDRIMLLHYESLSYFGEAIWPKVFAFLESAKQPYPRPLPELPTFRNGNAGYRVTKRRGP